MKYLLVMGLMTFVAACQAKNSTPPAAPATSAVAPEASKPEEDCDDKAKQKVEIKEETISLTNPTAGCSLDEAQK